MPSCDEKIASNGNQQDTKFCCLLLINSPVVVRSIIGLSHKTINPNDCFESKRTKKRTLSPCDHCKNKWHFILRKNDYPCASTVVLSSTKIAFNVGIQNERNKYYMDILHALDSETFMHRKHQLFAFFAWKQQPYKTTSITVFVVCMSPYGIFVCKQQLGRTIRVWYFAFETKENNPFYSQTKKLEQTRFMDKQTQLLCAFETSRDRICLFWWNKRKKQSIYSIFFGFRSETRKKQRNYWTLSSFGSFFFAFDGCEAEDLIFFL